MSLILQHHLVLPIFNSKDTFVFDKSYEPLNNTSNIKVSLPKPKTHPKPIRAVDTNLNSCNSSILYY